MQTTHSNRQSEFVISKSSFSCLAVLLCLLVLNVSCTALTREIEQVDQKTAVLSTEVKSALIAEPAVDAAAILVTVEDDGSVVLSGFVGGDAERQAAMKAAGDAAPGTKVLDQLETR